MFYRILLLLIIGIVTGQADAWSAQSIGMVVVQKGENLVDVATRCGVSPHDLIKINKLEKPYQIYIGQPLKYLKPAEKPKVAEKPAAPEPAKPVSTQLEKVEAAPAPAATPVSAPEEKATPELKRSGKHFSWPVEGKIISGFGKKKLGLKNDGINIAAKFQTPVQASEDGVVAYAGNEIRGFGNMILIKHAEKWTTTYAHNDILLVAKGDTVKRGQTIAKSGNTGHVDTPQVHFELRHQAKPVDPLKHLK